MKSVFSFFSRPEEDHDGVTTYRPREPTLQPPATVRPQSARYGTMGASADNTASVQRRPAAAPAPTSTPAAPAAAATTQGKRPEADRHQARETPIRPLVPEPSSATAPGRTRRGAPDRERAASSSDTNEDTNVRRDYPPEEAIPSGYADLVGWFGRTVADRKSPYNALVKAADRLKDFIPNETSRLQAALAICGDQWTPETLSLAINAHVADIESARKKALSYIEHHSAERATHLSEEAGDIRERNARLRGEIQTLRDKLARLETDVLGNEARLAELDEQIRLAQNGIGSAGFIDQAAENLKNDLLAKKVILGLP